MSNYKHRRTALILAVFLPVQILLLQLVRQFPYFIEDWYSRGVYPFMARLSRHVFGWIPFSLGDLFYLVLGLIALRWLYRNVPRLRYEPVWFMIDIVGAISLVHIVFMLLWGLNYYRIPLHETLGLDDQYTTSELTETTERLIVKANQLHRTLGYPDTVKIDLPYSQKDIFRTSTLGYEVLADEFPELDYHPRSLKKSGWSLGLTYMGYSGYYNPFTGEAQVNNLIKTYKFPVVSCHEEAHQIGYAAENEANFIATLATINNPDPYIQYSGYIFALRYCVNEMARRDIDRYHQMLKKINPGILKSYKEMRDFWAQYKNPFENVSKMFWDQFLKANNQSKGIMSYSYMVALVVNYFEDKPL